MLPCILVNKNFHYNYFNPENMDVGLCLLAACFGTCKIFMFIFGNVHRPPMFFSFFFRFSVFLRVLGYRSTATEQKLIASVWTQAAVLHGGVVMNCSSILFTRAPTTRARLSLSDRKHGRSPEGVIIGRVDVGGPGGEYGFAIISSFPAV